MVSRLRTLLAMAAVLLVGAACVGGSSTDGTSNVVHDVPFEVGERLVYDLIGREGVAVGQGTLSVVAWGDSLELTQSYRELLDGTLSDVVDQVAVRSDVRLLSHTLSRAVTSDGRDNSYTSEYNIDATTGRAESVTFGAVEGGESSEKTIDVEGSYYDNETSLWLWRTLDFAEEYEARYVSVSHLDRSLQTVILRVIDQQEIEVPAGVFQTWRLQVRSGRATRTAWVNVQAPHEIVQWDNSSLIFRLRAIESAGD
jgi:hypothetical protein